MTLTSKLTLADYRYRTGGDPVHCTESPEVTHVPERKWRLHRRECSAGCQFVLFTAAIHLFRRSGSTGNL